MAILKMEQLLLLMHLLTLYFAREGGECNQWFDVEKGPGKVKCGYMRKNETMILQESCQVPERLMAMVQWICWGQRRWVIFISQSLEPSEDVAHEHSLINWINEYICRARWWRSNRSGDSLWANRWRQRDQLEEWLLPSVVLLWPAFHVTQMTFMMQSLNV